ncbi:MAG: single-stranded DNA-binding protein [Breznakibacter sp.]|nr:single-stranded DNA-binding protein [Breznakibacter sp.]
MFKMFVGGALGQDAQIKVINGQSLISFDVAVKRDSKNAAGEKVEKTEWIQANLWKKEGESTKVAEYLKKGKMVIVEGTPSIEQYKNKEGETKTSYQLRVKELTLM